MNCRRWYISLPNLVHSTSGWPFKGLRYLMHPCNPICRSCHCTLCPVVLPMTSWIGHWLGIYSAVVGWVWTAHLRVREAQSHHQIPGGFAYGWNHWSNGESFPSSSKISKISCRCLEQGCLFWREEAKNVAEKSRLDESCIYFFLQKISVVSWKVQLSGPKSGTLALETLQDTRDLLQNSRVRGAQQFPTLCVCGLIEAICKISRW